MNNGKNHLEIGFEGKVRCGHQSPRNASRNMLETTCERCIKLRDKDGDAVGRLLLMYFLGGSMPRPVDLKETVEKRIGKINDGKLLPVP